MVGGAHPEGSGWRAIGNRVRNWGRWGDEDELGTVNMIGPAEVRRAISLVRTGKVFNLGIPLEPSGPQTGSERLNPVHFMSVLGRGEPEGGAFRYNDDYVMMPLQAASQWDALAHVYYDNQLYNGFSANVVDERGAGRLGIEKHAKGVIGRGVLLDVAAFMGVEWLAAGQVIEPALLDETAEWEGVSLWPGDIVLIRTGWRRKYRVDGDRGAFMGSEPGLGLASCEWLHDRRVAAVASDNWALEAIPSEVEGEPFVVHMVLIRDMGMLVGEMWDLDDLAQDCHADGVFECLLCAPVLPFTGAVGTPVNPLAVK